MGGEFAVLRTGNTLDVMVVGIQVGSAGVADLALLLHRAGQWQLAQHVGWAVDRNRTDLTLTRSEQASVLRVLKQCPVGLAALKQKLERLTRREP